MNWMLVVCAMNFGCMNVPMHDLDACTAAATSQKFRMVAAQGWPWCINSVTGQVIAFNLRGQERLK